MASNPDLENFVKWVSEGIKSPLYTPDLLQKIFHELRTYNTPEQWICARGEFSTFKDFGTFSRLAKEKIENVCVKVGLADYPITDFIVRDIMEKFTHEKHITIRGSLPSLVVASGDNLIFGRGDYIADVLVVRKRTFPYLSWKKPQKSRIFHIQITMATLKWDYKTETLSFMKL